MNTRITRSMNCKRCMHYHAIASVEEMANSYDGNPPKTWTGVINWRTWTPQQKSKKLIIQLVISCHRSPTTYPHTAPPNNVPGTYQAIQARLVENQLTTQGTDLRPVSSSTQTLVNHQYLDPNSRYHLWRLAENVKGTNLQPWYPKIIIFKHTVFGGDMDSFPGGLLGMRKGLRKWFTSCNYIKACQAYF